MSVTDPADPVQPDEGQGGQGNETPYAEYLNRIPEEARGPAEEAFKAWDANTTQKFQEQAEARKAWEPYEAVGVNQISPEEVQWALQFRQAAVENPQAVKEWYDSYAQQHGLAAAQEAAAAAEQQQTDLFGYQDPSAQQLEQLLTKQLGPITQQLEQFGQWREQQEFSQRKAEADRYVENQLAELKTKHPDEFNQSAVEKLVAQYIETDPRNAVQRAFADWQSIRTQVEKDTLQSKVDAPPPAESGGVVNGAPEEITTMEQAGRIALERLRGSRT